MTLTIELGFGHCYSYSSRIIVLFYSILLMDYVDSLIEIERKEKHNI
jgi:hypothetical protein